jgi:cell volume regulation protein A
MDLKHNLNSVLEIESGSNDPFAHMMTMLLITMATGGSQNTLLMIFLQLALAAASGLIFAKLGQWLINKLNVEIDGIYGVLLCGVAFLAFGAANQFGGNGFLAVYIAGMYLGNSKLVYKRFLSRLYNAFSMLSQILLFIVLGILFIPYFMKSAIISGVIVAVFLIVIARPIVMFVLMKPFKRPLNQIALVSWAGFRGASSIVFATHLLTAELPYAQYVFSVVFSVCMISVIVQGSLIVPIAKKLNLIDS